MGIHRHHVFPTPSLFWNCLRDAVGGVLFGGPCCLGGRTKGARCCVLGGGPPARYERETLNVGGIYGTQCTYAAKEINKKYFRLDFILLTNLMSKLCICFIVFMPSFSYRYIRLLLFSSKIPHAVGNM